MVLLELVLALALLVCRSDSLLVEYSHDCEAKLPLDKAQP